RAARLQVHAMPAGPAWRRRRGPHPRRPAEHRHSRGAQQDARADGRALPHAQGMRAMPRLSGTERTIVVTALRHAVLYVRMYTRKVFVLKAGGDAFTTPRSEEHTSELQSRENLV